MSRLHVKFLGYSNFSCFNADNTMNVCNRGFTGNSGIASISSVAVAEGERMLEQKTLLICNNMFAANVHILGLSEWLESLTIDVANFLAQSPRARPLMVNACEVPGSVI